PTLRRDTRCTTDPCSPGNERRRSRHLDLDDAVHDAHRERIDWLRRRQRPRLAGADVDVRAVPGADRDARIGIEVALAKRSVVVRAAVLEREELAVQVVDADGDRAGVDDL